MKKNLILGLGHGFNDFIAGYLIGFLADSNQSLNKIGISVFVYNLIAFGGQVPLAYLFRKKYDPRLYLLLCFGSIILSLFVFRINIELAILLSAFSSAIIHVVGGYECSRYENKAKGLGIFASPGVIGLAAGGILAHFHIPVVLPSLAIGAVFIFMLYFIKFETGIPYSEKKETGLKMEKHDLIMIILLSAIGLRSAVWNIFQIVNQENYTLLIYIALAAGMGKLAGGVLSDRIGHRRYTISALVISIPLLTVFRNNFISLCTGIFLLQSTFAATTRIIINHFRYFQLLGVSFAFGLSLFLAMIISVLSSFSGNVFLTGTILLICVILFVFESRIRKRLN